MHLIHFAYCNESALYAFAGSGLSKLSTAIMEYSHVRVDEPFGCLPSTSLIIQVNVKFCTFVNGAACVLFQPEYRRCCAMVS